MTFDQFMRNAGSLKHAFRAFRSRNYRLFFFGQGISATGSWMQGTALGWMVYRMTGSAYWLGVVAFASQIPMLLSPLAGALADRVNRRPILIAAQSVAMLQAFIFAALVYTNSVEYWHLVALALMVGLAMAVDIPTRQSFVVQMVDDKRDLPNALALNSLMFNSARFIGPVLAGFMIAAWGEACVFAVNGVSYLGVIISYFLMRTRPRPIAAARRHIFAELKEGFVYVFGHPAMRAVLLMLALTSLISMPYGTLLPVYAKDIFRGDSHTLGMLMGCVGIGAVIGALFLASRRDASGLVRHATTASMGLCAGIAAFAFSTWLPLSAALLTLTGACMMVFVVGSNTLIQTMVADDKRGRLMGLFGLCFLGTAPFGNYLAGTAARLVGAPWTLFVGGTLCLIAMVFFSRHLREIAPAHLGEHRAAPLAEPADPTDAGTS